MRLIDRFKRVIYMEKKKIMLLCFFISIILPVIIGTMYAIPAADDFANSMGWIECSGNHLSYLNRRVYEVYMTWQGTYTGNYLAAFPVYYVFGIKGYRIWLFLTTCFFISSFMLWNYMFVNTIEVLERNNAFILLSCLGLFYLFGTNLLDETFYWYTGTCVYTIPASCMLLASSFHMKYVKCKRRCHLVFACIFAFISAGGSLAISGFLCSLLLWLVLYSIIVSKATDSGIPIFAAAVLGSIINCIAPGNFTRHTLIDSNIIWIGALRVSIERITGIISDDIGSGLLLVIFVVVFVYACKNLKESRFIFKHPVCVTLYGLIAIVITEYPVVLGYSGVVRDSRIVFIEHMILLYQKECHWGKMSNLELVVL